MSVSQHSFRKCDSRSLSSLYSAIACYYCFAYPNPYSTIMPKYYGLLYIVLSFSSSLYVVHNQNPINIILSSVFLFIFGQMNQDFLYARICVYVYMLYINIFYLYIFLLSYLSLVVPKSCVLQDFLMDWFKDKNMDRTSLCSFIYCPCF